MRSWRPPVVPRACGESRARVPSRVTRDSVARQSSLPSRSTRIPAVGGHPASLLRSRTHRRASASRSSMTGRCRTKTVDSSQRRRRAITPQSGFTPSPATTSPDLPTTPRFGSIVWLRFWLPDLLLDRSRALYLDSDTLVMSDLHALWDTPLDAHPLAAVANVVEPSTRPHVRPWACSIRAGSSTAGSC